MMLLYPVVYNSSLISKNVEYAYAFGHSPLYSSMCAKIAPTPQVEASQAKINSFFGLPLTCRKPPDAVTSILVALSPPKIYAISMLH